MIRGRRVLTNADLAGRVERAITASPPPRYRWRDPARVGPERLAELAAADRLRALRAYAPNPARTEPEDTP